MNEEILLTDNNSEGCFCIKSKCYPVSDLKDEAKRKKIKAYFFDEYLKGFKIKVDEEKSYIAQQLMSSLGWYCDSDYARYLNFYPDKQCYGHSSKSAHKENKLPKVKFKKLKKQIDAWNSILD